MSFASSTNSNIFFQITTVQEFVGANVWGNWEILMKLFALFPWEDKRDISSPKKLELKKSPNYDETRNVQRTSEIVVKIRLKCRFEIEERLCELWIRDTNTWHGWQERSTWTIKDTSAYFSIVVLFTKTRLTLSIYAWTHRNSKHFSLLNCNFICKSKVVKHSLSKSRNMKINKRRRE
jgi:hypothetical protein